MNVTLIHQAFAAKSDPGGTRHFEFAERLIRNGHTFRVIASDVNYATGRRVTSNPSLFATRIEDGIPVTRAYTLETLHKSFVWRVVAFLGFMVTSLIAALRSGPTDLVIGTTPPLFQAITAYVVSTLRRRPFLLEVRDLWPEFAIDMGVLKNPVLIKISRLLELFLYRHATHIVVNSPAYTDYIAAKGIPPTKISLVANGVDVAMFNPKAKGESFRQLIHSGDKFVVTYAGAIGIANDIGVVLDAAESLSDRKDILFAIVGDGKERARLQADAERRNLPNVVFTGPVPKTEMPNVLAGSDACLAVLQNIPMFTTTYPNKVFDYMAAARPTLLLIDGVIREVLEAARGGIAVAPGDAQALAAAVVQLSESRDEAVRMGESAREYVSVHFNRDKQAREFEDVLARVAVQGV